MLEVVFVQEQSSSKKHLAGELWWTFSLHTTNICTHLFLRKALHPSELHPGDKALLHHGANTVSNTRSLRTPLPQGFLSLSQFTLHFLVSIELSFSLDGSGCFYTMAITHMTIQRCPECLLRFNILHSTFSQLPAFTFYADRSSFP